ncbi:class I SAM-dependent methyltransferase [Aeromonas veronii]|uniref:class I SAM-dependent methyltransferase n=1 Tax=Aeromonas veronii TaxID=654 RepID=UPI0031FC4980
MNKSTQDGAKVYTPLTLKVYDWWVLGISNRFAWKCSTSDYLVPHFKKHLGQRHLDIGVGTGFYLQYVPEEIDISLMDMNANSLAVAKERVSGRCCATTIQHDIFESIPIECEGGYDSVSLYYLLHCLPGTLAEKRIALLNASKALKSNGTLFGATILGYEVNHNLLGRKLMHTYNSKGIFSNIQDTEAGLRHELSSLFENVVIHRVGKVALFSASGRIERLIT